MSDYVFPALPLLAVDVERESLTKGEVYENPGGTEQRVSYYATPRYRFNLRYEALQSNVAAPSPWQAYSELGVVLYFFDTHLGQFDSFLYVDPVDGTQRRVRFEAESLRIKKLVANMYAVSLSLVTVGA